MGEQAKLQWQAERQELERQLEAKEKAWSHPSTLEDPQSGSRAQWRRTRALPPCLKEGNPPASSGRPADRPPAEPVSRSRLHFSKNSTHTDLRRVEDKPAIGNLSVAGN